MNPNKLSGFTITELLVVLVVSSILLTSATWLYSNVSSYQIRLQQRIEKVNAVNRLEFLIKKDLKHYPDLAWGASVLSSKKGRITYAFYPDSVVRHQQGVKEFFGVGANAEVLGQELIVGFNLYEQPITLRFERPLDYRHQWSNENRVKK